MLGGEREPLYFCMVGWFPNNPCVGLARISNYFLATAAAFDKDEKEGGMKHPHLYLPPSLSPFTPHDCRY